MPSHTTCPCCGAELTIAGGQPKGERPASRPPHHQRRACDPSPQPMTPERAAAFVMPFGKHEGRTLAEIAQADPEYIAWGATQFDRGVGRAFTFMAGLLARPSATSQADAERLMAEGAY